METNETEVVTDSQETSDETVEETAETSEETTTNAKETEVKSKPAETPEARLSRLERQVAQQKKKMGIKDEAEKPANTEAKSELDYGEKAFLRSYNIKGADELNLVKNWVKRTGDSLDVIVEDEIFTAKLSALREARATDEAIPKGSKRSASPAPNDESYWEQKIQSGQANLQDIPDVEMRRKVLNKRIEKESRGNRFAQNAVVKG